MKRDAMGDLAALRSRAGKRQTMEAKPSLRREPPRFAKCGSRSRSLVADPQKTL